MSNPQQNLTIEDLYRMFPDLATERFGPYEDFIRPTAAVSPEDTWLFGLGNRYNSFGDMLARNLLSYDDRGNIRPGFLGTPYMLFKNTTKVPLTLEEQRLQAYNDALARNLFAVEDKINSIRKLYRGATPEQLNIVRTNTSGLSSPDDYDKKRNFLTKVVGLPEKTVLDAQSQRTIDRTQARYDAAMKAEADKWNNTVNSYNEKIKHYESLAKDPSLSAKEREEAKLQAVAQRLALNNYKDETKRNAPAIINRIKEETGMTSDANRKAIVAQQAANTAFVEKEPDRFAENSKNIIDKDVRISTTNRSVPVDFKIETPLERAERMFVNPVINAGKVVLDKAKDTANNAAKKIQDFSKNKGEEYKNRAAKNNQPPASVSPATIPGYPMGTRGY